MAKYINVVEDPRGRAMHGWSGDGDYDTTYDGVRLTWGDRAVVEVPHGQITALLYVDTPSGLPASVAVGASNLARGVSSPYLVDSGRTLRQVFSVTSGNGVAIDVYEPELEPVEPPIEDGEPETEPEPGEPIAEDTVIVRLAVIEGNVEHSRYFDGDTSDSAYERYEWVGPETEAVIHENLVTNPRGRNTSGTVTIRENRMRPLSHSGWNSTGETLYRSGGVWEMTVPEGTSGNVLVPGATAWFLDLAPGEVVSAAYSVENIGPVEVGLRLAFWDNVDYQYGDYIYIPPGETRRVSYHGAVVQEGAQYMQPRLHSTSQPADTVIRVSEPVMEKASVAGPFFDGDTWDGDPDFTPEWTGTPGDSASRLVAPKPVRWGTQTGALTYYSESKDAVAIRATGAANHASTYIVDVGSYSQATVLAELVDASTSEPRDMRARWDYTQTDWMREVTAPATLRATETGVSGALYALQVNNPEPGDTFYVRSAAMEGEYHGPYFDGHSEDTETHRYEWEGAEDNSVSQLVGIAQGASLATILSRRKPCGVYFGSAEHAEWLASPDSGVPISLEGWGDNGTFLNGGAFVRRSATHHHRYNMSWTAISGEEVERIKAYFDGLYGQGPFHFVLPGTFHNVLPQSWSIPRLGGEGAPPLVVGHKPRMVPDHLATEGRPPASAHYTAIVEGQRRQVLTIPVPDDMVLHLGVRGSFSGTSMVYEVDEVQHELPPLVGSDLTNRMVVGPTFVHLSLQGEGVAIINSMTAALTPTFNPPTGRFRPGMGHSGVQFPHNGMSLSLDSAAKDLWSASVTLIETQQWR